MKNVLSKLLKVQLELKAPKNQYNEFGHFYYRSCEDILEGTKPLCEKYNCLILLTDTIKMVGDRIYVEATATFFDIDSEECIVSVACAREEDKKDKMDRSQTTGSASSYARKYALNGLLQIDDTKDSDGLEPDKAPKQGQKTVSKPTAQPKTQSKIPTSSTEYANQTPKKITEAQRKRLFALGNETDIRAVMKEYKIEHTADIPMSKYDEICKKVEEKKNGAKQQSNS